MAGSRTLKLALLADIADFSKNINSAGTQSQTLGDQFEAFGKRAALAFAAAAAAIGAYAAAAIKNAAADEAAQRNLALTIENTTTATSKQIAGVEDYISKTSLAIGVTDDQLRPAFGRLVRSTKDVEEAQKLLNLALDISSATGKPLETVANALGKAYDGNLTSLGKLGLGIDQSIIKSKDFDKVFQSLTGTFGGFAENEAQSTEKAFARIKIASDEVQEQIGTALLPLIQELTAFILTDVVPVIQQFVNGLTGAGGLQEGLTDSETTALEWGKRIRSLIGTVIEFKDELIAVAAVIGTIFVVSKISAAVTATIALIKTLIAAYNALKASAIIAGIATAFALNPLLGVGAVALAAAVLAGANALLGSNSGGETNFAVGGAPGAISGGGGGSTGGSGGTGGGTGGGGGGGGTVAKSIAKNVVNEITGDPGGTNGVAGAGTTDSQNTARLIAAAAAAAATMSDINARQMAIRAKEQGNQPATINITVNGAIDKEGTARTIVETLNNSYYRGTGGASALQAI
jgi:hypothetical protein